MMLAPDCPAQAQLETPRRSPPKLLAALSLLLLLSAAPPRALPTPRAPITYTAVEVSPGITLDVATAGPPGGETLLLLHGCASPQPIPTAARPASHVLLRPRPLRG